MFNFRIIDGQGSTLSVTISQDLLNYYISVVSRHYKVSTFLFFTVEGQRLELFVDHFPQLYSVSVSLV